MNIYELAFVTFSCGMFAVVTFLLLLLIALKPEAFSIFIKSGTIIFGILLLILVSLANYIDPTKDIWSLISVFVSVAIIGFMMPAIYFLKANLAEKFSIRSVYPMKKTTYSHFASNRNSAIH